MSILQKKESGCKFGNKNKCVLMHRQVEDQPSKKPKKDNDKSAVAMLKDARHLGYVFQDTEPPESSSIFAEEPRMHFSKTTLRQANIRESKGPSLGVIQIKNPHQGSPYAPKFEDRSQEEAERQERCARGDAWRMAKSILKLKEKAKSTFFSP